MKTGNYLDFLLQRIEDENTEKELKEQYSIAIHSMPADAVLEYLRTEPYAIGYIDNPTEEQQLLATSHYISIVVHIKNPTEKVIRNVLQKDIRYAKGDWFSKLNLSEAFRDEVNAMLAIEDILE